MEKQTKKSNVTAAKVRTTPVRIRPRRKPGESFRACNRITRVDRKSPLPPLSVATTKRWWKDGKRWVRLPDHSAA